MLVLHNNPHVMQHSTTSTNKKVCRSQVMRIPVHNKLSQTIEGSNCSVEVSKEGLAWEAWFSKESKWLLLKIVWFTCFLILLMIQSPFDVVNEGVKIKRLSRKTYSAPEYLKRKSRTWQTWSTDFVGSTFPYKIGTSNNYWSEGFDQTAILFSAAGQEEDQQDRHKTSLDMITILRLRVKRERIEVFLETMMGGELSRMMIGVSLWNTSQILSSCILV